MTSWCSSGDFNTEPSAGCFALQPPVTRSASATLGHSPAACPGHQPLSQQQRREAPGQSQPRYGAAAASSAPAEGPASAAEGGAAVTEAQRVSKMGPQGLAEWHKGKPKARGSRAASRPRGTPLGSGSEPLGHEEGRGQAPELSGATRPCCSHSLGWGRAAGATQPPGTAQGTPSRTRQLRANASGHISPWPAGSCSLPGSCLLPVLFLPPQLCFAAK